MWKLWKFTQSIFSQKFRQITVLSPKLQSVLFSRNIFPKWKRVNFSFFHTVRYVVVRGLSTSILFRQNGYFWTYICYLWYRLTSEKYLPVRMKAIEYRMYLHIFSETYFWSLYTLNKSLFGNSATYAEQIVDRWFHEKNPTILNVESYCVKVLWLKAFKTTFQKNTSLPCRSILERG